MSNTQHCWSQGEAIRDRKREVLCRLIEEVYTELWVERPRVEDATKPIFGVLARVLRTVV